MAGKVILIIGLPASGKTTLAKKKYVKQGYVLIDDPYSYENGYFTTVADGDIRVDLSLDFVICDPFLCEAKNREKAKELLKEFEIEEIFFEKNVDKCVKNNRLRGRLINWKIFSYDLPDNVETIPIWQP